MGLPLQTALVWPEWILVNVHSLVCSTVDKQTSKLNSILFPTCINLSHSLARSLFLVRPLLIISQIHKKTESKSKRNTKVILYSILPLLEPTSFTLIMFCRFLLLRTWPRFIVLLINESTLFYYRQSLIH